MYGCVSEGWKGKGVVNCRIYIVIYIVEVLNEKVILV